MGAKRNAYGKARKKETVGRPILRYVDNIKMDLKEIGWSGMDCTDVAQDRESYRALVNTAMKLRVP
jgi:hypothetical protein